MRGKEIKPCTGCYDCQTQGFCTIAGDDFEEIFTRMRAADGLILGSPVYLSSVVPQMMALLSRATFVSYWNDKFFNGKVGGPDHRGPAGRAQPGVLPASALVLFQRPDRPRIDLLECGSGRHRGGPRCGERPDGLEIGLRTFARNLAGLMKKLF